MKYLFYVIAFIATGTVFSQSIADGVRFGTNNMTGTARYRAMGGAFGALGGDLSAIADNPAASAVFTSGSASITFAGDTYDNRTSYFGGNTNVSDTDLSINQAGGVFVIDGAPNSNWKKITLAFNYDRTNNLDNSFIAQGLGNTSISTYFTDFAQGVPLELLETIDGETVSDLYLFLGENEGYGAQQALLGFQSFIIDPATNDLDNTTYFGNIGGQSFNQEYSFISEGYNGKASFNLGAQYNDNLYMGINLNSHFFEYNQSSVLNESTSALSDGEISVQQVRFENNLRSLGNGFSFQLGAIGKVADNVRLGFTYDSPTWFTISDENSQRIRTTAVDDIGSFTTDVDPRITNIFQDYNLKTPGKYTGSVAYLFGVQGLISFDYSYRDFTNLSFGPENDPFFNAQNNQIDDILRGVSSYKLGGEYRFEEWSLRAGYRYEDSPYVNKTTVGDLTGYSVGLGYNFGSVKLDLAYDTFSQDRNQQLYTTGLTSRANVQGDNSSIVATLSLNL